MITRGMLEQWLKDAGWEPVGDKGQWRHAVATDNWPLPFQEAVMSQLRRQEPSL